VEYFCLGSAQILPISSNNSVMRQFNALSLSGNNLLPIMNSGNYREG
jgi:hypothetical protein